MRLLTRTLLAVLAAALIGSPVALAAPAASGLGFTITAVGFKSYFVYDTRPGRTVRGVLQVQNQTAKARRILLAPVDVSTAAGGGLQYGDGAAQLDGRWVQLSASSVRLAGGATVNVPFTVAIPPTASTGEHFVGITALDSRVLSRPAAGHGPIRLRLIPRLAMTIELRLPGRTARRMALGPIAIAVAPSGASLTLALSDPSNNLIPSTNGNLTVSQGRTQLFHSAIPVAAFVPRTAITYHVPWQGTPVEGTYRVRGVLRPSRAPAIVFDRTVTFGQSAIQKYRQQTGRQAKQSSGTPALLIIVLIAALALAILFAVAYARLRRRLREQSDGGDPSH